MQLTLFGPEETAFVEAVVFRECHGTHYRYYASGSTKHRRACEMALRASPAARVGWCRLRRTRPV